MGRAETKVTTDRVLTGSRSFAWLEFPYCRRCKWHVLWSGRRGVGVVRLLSWLFAGGGVVAGVSLGLHGESPDEGSAVVYAVLFAIGGYLLAMALVALVGLVIAPRKPACTARGPAVRARRTEGWQLRFSNPTYEDAFRTSNQGF